jgi:hypothetical protein
MIQLQWPVIVGLLVEVFVLYYMEIIWLITDGYKSTKLTLYNIFKTLLLSKLYVILVIFCLKLRGKGKAVPLQAWSDPEASRKLRFPDYMTTAQDGGKVVSLTHRSPLPPPPPQ